MALIAKERDERNSAALIVTYRYQDGEIMADFRYDSVGEDLVNYRTVPIRRSATALSLLS